MSARDYIFEANKANFNQLVLENSQKGPVLVNYWAPWAGPCLKLYPELESLVAEFNGRFILVNVNTEEQKQLAKDNQVNSLPTVKIYLDEEVVETIHGAFSISEYRRIINSLMPTDTDELIAKSLQQFNASDKETALSALAKQAMEEPENAKLAVTLGRLLLINGQHDDAYQVMKNLPNELQGDAEINALIVHLELNQAASDISSIQQITDAIDKNPQDCLPLLQYAAISLFNDDYETSLSYFLSILQKDREFYDDIGRRGLLSIFHTLGDEHAEIVDKYRSLMFNALH